MRTRGSVAPYVLAAAILVTACGGADAGSSSSSGCGDAEPVRVGASFALSGPAASIGAEAREGAELAVEDLNDEGGILDRCVELVLRDDAGDPTKAAQVGRELVDREQVDYIVGPFLGSAAGPQLEVTAASGTPQVIMAAAPVIDTEEYPFVFSTEIAAAQVAGPLIELIDERGWQQLGIVGVNDAGGVAGLEVLEPAAADRGIEVTSELEPVGTVDRLPAMRRLRSAGVDAVYVNAPQAPDQIAVITARNQLDWDVPILGTSAIAFAAVTDSFDGDEMANVFASNSYAALARDAGSDSPAGRNAPAFQSRLREFRGEDVLTSSMQIPAGAYDSIMMIAQAADETDSLDAESIRSYLEENGYDGVKATYAFTEDDHQGVESDDLVLTVASSLHDGTLEIAR